MAATTRTIKISSNAYQALSLTHKLVQLTGALGATYIIGEIAIPNLSVTSYNVKVLLLRLRASCCGKRVLSIDLAVWMELSDISEIAPHTEDHSGISHIASANKTPRDVDSHFRLSL